MGYGINAFGAIVTFIVVEGMESFEQAKVEFESAIGQKSEYPWLSFDEFGAPE